MLRELTKTDWLSILGVPEERIPNVLLLRGTRNLKLQYERYLPYFCNVMEIGCPIGIVEDVLIGDYAGHSVAYASVYGAAMASEVVHLFGALGTRLVIQTGCCGALADEIETGDLVLPEEAYCGEGAAQYYKLDGRIATASYPPSAVTAIANSGDVSIHRGAYLLQRRYWPKERERSKTGIGKVGRPSTWRPRRLSPWRSISGCTVWRSCSLSTIRVRGATSCSAMRRKSLAANAEMNA